MYRRTNEGLKSQRKIAKGMLVKLKPYLESKEHDMEDNFIEDIKRAELWLEEETPSTLYYNHGQYMVDSRYKGIK